ncbi:hypothetical protein SO802_019137 [Lithocarpus litseifolius]|uniref:Uncharacterized protein n=1 Tax=Lithocarpus litseifolius TaxID=425828 RepID=A0AAW2CMX6_9ROSI
MTHGSSHLKPPKPSDPPPLISSFVSLQEPRPNPDLPTTYDESKDESAVVEELAESDSDESGAAIDGLGVNLGESEEERVDNLGESGEERVDEVWRGESR